MFDIVNDILGTPGSAMVERGGIFGSGPCGEYCLSWGRQVYPDWEEVDRWALIIWPGYDFGTCLSSRGDCGTIDWTLAVIGVIPGGKGVSLGAKVAIKSVTVRIAARGSTTLYRAVSPAELADIQASAVLRSIAGLEGKYFTTSAEAASSYARQAVRAFGDPPYTLIRTEVPNSIFRGLTPAAVDSGIPAWVIPNSRLPGLTPQVLDVMPVP